MKTWNAKEGDVERAWWVVDASGQTVGRLATQIAAVLRGKNKPQFTPHVDTGDFVVVLNAKDLKFTGGKSDDKVYVRHTGYMGALKETKAKDLQAEKPEQVIVKAVQGMLPKNRLSNKLITKLKVYSGAEHPHEAQKPRTLGLSS